LQKPAVRVLIVDDNEAWRRFVRSALESQPELQVIDEACDGLEAVQKCQELHPDLVVLDIGLPVLNGIEAARQIFQLRPETRILFVSEQRSADIVEAALQTGARGFVLKSDAAAELLPAVEAVLEGKPFVSSSLAGSKFVASVNHEAATFKHCHEVEFFADDASAIEGYARFIESALNSGKTVVFVATERHRAEVLRRLERDGVDVTGAIGKERYISLDVAETLSKIVIDDRPDGVRCAELVHELIARAQRGVQGEHSRVVFFGECAPTLLSQGNVEGAIEMERVWDQITRNHDSDVFCVYLWNSLPGRESNPLFQRICAEHTAVHRG
jgi:CheY-like chemotaxis protein